MDALLIDRWLAGAPYLSTPDEAAVSVVREELRAIAHDVGFDTTVVSELAILVSELATNQMRHARLGRIAMRTIERAGTRGIEILAADRGRGINDCTGALSGIPRSSGSLGTGVSTVVRFADEVDFDVRLGEGTAIWARRFVSRVPRRREVAILSRPADGESTIGDDATFVRQEGRLVLALADGLGHGVLARDASAGAVAIVHGTVSLTTILEDAHEALQGTRGAVMSVVDVDEGAGTLAHAGIGNIVTQVVDRQGAKNFSSPAFVLGTEGSTVRGRVRPESRAITGQDVILMFSDGLSTRTRLEPRDDVARRHPLAIADHALRTFGRTRDDATIVVAA